jgi:glutamate--cysteine ligase
VAIFANSPLYEGRNTGWRSTRSRAWRELDPMRTGLPYDTRAPLDEYLQFALDAPAMLMPAVNGVNRSFREWLETAAPTFEEWRDHLSTLFPEVRPRGHMELRSADAVAPEWYAAPLALVAGIVYDPEALRAAVDLLGQPDLGLLQRAGRLGLTDPAIAETANDLATIALAGCERLGPAYFRPDHLDEARAFFERYTLRGRSPADDTEREAIVAKFTAEARRTRRTSPRRSGYLVSS